MIGFVAAFLVAIAYVPQCITLYLTKNVDGLSWKTFLAIWIAMVLFSIHAIIIGDLPLLLSSIASFLQNSYILIMIIKYRKCG